MADTDNEQWLVRMLTLLPGFLTVGIARYVGSIDELGGEFELTLYSLALSLVDYVLAGVICSVPAYSQRVRLRIGKARQSQVALAHPAGTVFAVVNIIVAVGLGVGIGWAYESDAFLRAVRWMPGGYHVTKRSSERPLIFLLSSIRQGQLEEGRPPRFKQKEAWLEVLLDVGEKNATRRIAGYAEFFSLRGEKGEVFLSPACVEVNGIWKPHDGPGLLFRDDGAKLIALVDRDSHTCPKLWAALAQPPAAPVGNAPAPKP